MAALCSAAVCLPACKDSTEKKSEAQRAPRLERQERKKSPTHPDILALGEEMTRGLDGYDAVRKRLFALPRELSRDDSTALLDLLLAPPDKSWSELGWAAIVNDGFNILRGVKTQPENFMKRLVELHRDGTRPAVLRDYALQHFGSQLAGYYHDPAGAGKRICPDAEVRRQAEDALRTTLESGDGAASGTACNVADDILTASQSSGATPPVSREELDRVCHKAALNPEANLHARLSALGMLGRHRSPLALKEARGWMMDGKQPALLRAAAISYAGQFALEADRDALTTLAADNDLRLALPAREGLKSLGRRDD